MMLSPAAFYVLDKFSFIITGDMFVVVLIDFDGQGVGLYRTLTELSNLHGIIDK